MTTTQQVYGKKFGGNAAENYEQYFVPAIGRPLAVDLVAAAALRSGDRVLDVGCGTGVVTRLAAEQVGPGGSVAGADMTAGMLEVARSVAPSPSRIQWYETSAEAMPLPDNSFDVVFCQLALQFIADKAAAVREIHRVLAPGGRTLVTVPTPSRFFDVFERILARHVPSAAPFVAMVFSLNDPAALERLFRNAGFKDVAVQSLSKRLRLPSPQEFLWQYVHSTPMSGLVGDVSQEVRAALERDVAAGWREWLTDGGLTYEQPILRATARKSAAGQRGHR